MLLILCDDFKITVLILLKYFWWLSTPYFRDGSDLNVRSNTVLNLNVDVRFIIANKSLDNHLYLKADDDTIMLLNLHKFWLSLLGYKGRFCNIWSYSLHGWKQFKVCVSALEKGNNSWRVPYYITANIDLCNIFLLFM